MGRRSGVHDGRHWVFTFAGIRNTRSTILIVDDTNVNLSLMRELLKPYYRTLMATSGEQALKLAGAENSPQLILLDIMMPEMDGYEVCTRLKGNPTTAHIPVIFLTAKTWPEDEKRGLEIGAVDFITKPINPPILLARVKNHLFIKAAQDALKNQNEQLEILVAERTRELTETKEATIFAMSSLAETRDNETGNHIRRTQHYVRALANALCEHPRFAHELTEDNIKLMFSSAPLHDIGKVGVPDAILLKPGALDDDEWIIMRKHVDFGRDAILAAEKMLSQESTFLHYAREIAYGHHEKWDGSGYPNGLKGDDIPISARLMAVADVYDALISRRVYKPPFPHEKAVAIITEGKGSHFDPDMVEVFLEISENFRSIALEFGDEETKL